VDRVVLLYGVQNAPSPPAMALKDTASYPRRVQGTAPMSEGSLAF